MRLAFAGLASLFLLAWIGFVPSGFPEMSNRYGRENPLASLGSASIAIIILVTLVPVLWRGRLGDRCLAALLAIFPLVVLAVIALAFSYLRIRD